jgi:pyruvate kinase
VTFLPIDSPANGRALQLIVTLGPASMSSVAALARAGATAFRLNASHLGAAELGDALSDIKAACPDAPVVVDLQGAKMRIERPEPVSVAEGETLRLTEGPEGDAQVPHGEFFKQVRPGDTVSLDDGRLRFAVEAVEAGSARVRALGAGRLLHRKGINVEQHPVQLERLTTSDREACRVAADHGVSAFAYSFMTDGRESDWIRDQVPGCSVVGKVERREATGRLSEIAGRVGAIWICRGDLGAQLGLAELARFVGGVDPTTCPVPVLMAGQVLEHLTRHPEPTRSEVCHLHDLIVRGFAGIVLSDETAVGSDPVHATAVAADLLASLRA